MELRRLPEAELEVMLVIWKGSPPMNSEYILKELEGVRSWQRATLLTVLKRLTDKGFLSCEKQYRNNLYQPLVTFDEYRKNEGKTMLEKLFGNSVSNMVAFFSEEESGLSEEELKHLHQLIDDMEV